MSNKSYRDRVAVLAVVAIALVAGTVAAADQRDFSTSDITKGGNVFLDRLGP